LKFCTTVGDRLFKEEIPNPTSSPVYICGLNRETCRGKVAPVFN